MNNFKKFVAVLLGVVMACVFATSAFAADVQNTAKAKATIQGFLAQKGVTTLSRTVDSLPASWPPSATTSPLWSMLSTTLLLPLLAPLMPTLLSLM